MQTYVRIVAVHPTDKRVLARKLRRRRRLSIDELSRRLGVSRSTVYNWVRDIPVPGSGPGGGFSKEARQRGNRKMSEGRRRLRESQYLCGVESYASLKTENAFRDFIVSYVALGKKGDIREVSFSHPDPLMMQIAAHWLEVYGRNRLRYQVTLPADADADRARAFWAERLAVDQSDIKVERRPAHTGQGAPQSKTSVLGALRISSTDTLLRIELQAWIDCARAEWRRAVEGRGRFTPPC